MSKQKLNTYVAVVYFKNYWSDLLEMFYKIGCTLSLVLFEADPDLDPDSCSMTSYPFFGFSAPVTKLYTKMFIIFVGYGFVVIPSSKVQYLQC